MQSRALVSFLTAVVGFLANMITGVILGPKFSQLAKSKFVYIGIAIFVTVSWVWNAIVQVKLSSRSEAPSFDLGGGYFFNSAFTVYMLFRFFYEMLQTYLYWLMGEIKGCQRNGDIARTTGILRSWESVGSAIAYGIGATDVSNLNQMIIGFALWGFTVPCTLMVIFGSWDVLEEVEDQPSVSSLEEQRFVTGDEEKK